MFAKAVEARPYQFGAGVMQFLLTLARGTYALPLSAVCKARRYARDDDHGGDSDAPQAAAKRHRDDPALTRRALTKMTATERADLASRWREIKATIERIQTEEADRW